jgi:all-trans-8'-apo-beta-carotenal 15,15'-oxygenase
MRRILGDAMRTVETELTDIPLAVEGALPPDLDGVLYRNGPGRFERGARRYLHPVDGDGHIARFDFSPDRVRYRNRFVRTAEYLAEERRGTLLYRSLGTNREGGPAANVLRDCKNAANTNIIWHAERLLALWEGGPPHRLDPESLDTLGLERFAGQLRNPLPPPLRWLSPPLLPFSAHPHLDAETGELIGFGLLFGPWHRLVIYRIGPDGRMARPELHPLPHLSFVHDVAVTSRWLCFLLPHAEFDRLGALLGRSTYLGAIRLATERPMTALLIPRDGGPARLIESVPGFVFHIAQAFDREDGRLIIDVIRYDAFPATTDIDTLFSAPRPEMVPHLERLEIDPETGRCEIRRWMDQAAELPTSAPGAIGAERRILYTVGAPPDRSLPYLSTIQRLDTATGELRVRDLTPDLAGEAIIVPGAGADDEGWLLSLVHRAHEQRSELLVLRAEDLTIQATLRLPHVLPYGFHGSWVARAARSR